MSTNDELSAGVTLQDLPNLPADSSGPVFAEPWQAQAFAMAVRMSEQGCFTWSEWVAEFSTELKAAAGRGEPDDGSHYYDHWVVTLERLTIQKALLDPTSLQDRKAAWLDAYLHTPHGQPVELKTDRR